MVKQKGKAHVKEQVEKLVKRKPMSKVKNSQKMLQWMKMDSNEFKWARQVDSDSLFNLQWTMLGKDLLQDFLQTWEAMKDGRILGQVRGQKIFIDQVLIHE